METARNLVIEREIARQDVQVFSDIITLNITGRDMLTPKGAKAPIHVQRRIQAIRHTLDRLRSPRKTAWGDMSQAHRNALEGRSEA